MSALAHYLEMAGIATSLIALVKHHAIKMQPPRALWVPFELGRPLGTPNDATLQTRVLHAVLGLLERNDGPVLLEDFPDDAPDEAGDPDWCSPLNLDSDDVGKELAQLRGTYDAARAAAGRTMAGLSGLSLEQAADWLMALADGDFSAAPRKDLAAPQLMHFAADDLKACYLEAAAWGPGRPSSWQLADWFWSKTAAAKLLHRLRQTCLDSSDERWGAVANSGLVPAAYLKLT